MSDGWCSFAARRPTTCYGYPQGTRGQNRPAAFVCHIMDGYKRTVDAAGFWEGRGASAHFGIGRDGSISQYVSILDASWANGVCGDTARYDRADPVLGALEREGSWIRVNGGYALQRSGLNVLNARTISIEHEGFPEQPWTEEMLASSLRVMLWCLGELQRAQRPMPRPWLVGHYQIDPVSRARCPGPNWPRERMLKELVAMEELRQSIEGLSRTVWGLAERLNAYERLLDAVLVPLVTGDRARAEQVMRYLYALAGKPWPA